jgi:hypothetical protein
MASQPQLRHENRDVKNSLQNVKNKLQYIKKEAINRICRETDNYIIN